MTKKCGKCKQQKDVLDFLTYKSGVNKGNFRSYCRKCDADYKRERTVRLSKNPWFKTYRRIENRCHWKRHQAYKYYLGKGIENELTVDQLKIIWERDCASRMKRPSIDRIDPNKNYSFENCRYIELTDNISRKSKGMK
jgi:hypothetical protein